MKDKGLVSMNIASLRDHVAQLTQGISRRSLKPVEKKIKMVAGGNSGSDS